MIYLSSFRFPSWDEEYKFRLDDVKRTCYNTMYPFFVLSRHFLYFTDRIKEGGLYLLDEPENSLAPDMQLKPARLSF